jgi:Flp pilus assembly protein TadB
MERSSRRLLRLAVVPALFAAIYIAVGLWFGMWGAVSVSVVWVAWLMRLLIAGHRKRRASAGDDAEGSK